MDEKPHAQWPWFALIALYLVLRLPALLSYAPTYDEPIYIGAGKHMLTRHEMDTAALLYHPPLAYHLTSLPLWFLDTPLEAWDPAKEGSQVGLGVLYGSHTHGGDVVPAETVLLLSRLPVLLFGLLGLVLSFNLGRRLAGERCGWLAAAAWAIDPLVAAQCVQATTDLVAAVAVLLVARVAIRHFDLAGVRPDFARSSHLTLGAACGLAALAKHTLLLPIAIVACASILLRITRWRGGIVQPRRPVLRFVCASAFALLVLWAGYAFEFGPLVPADGAHEHSATLSRMTGLDATTLDGLLTSVSVPAPTYWRSVADALLDKAGPRSGATWVGYLNGTWSERGFLAYFPLAVAVKTPTALLVLMFAGLPGWLFLRRRIGYPADLCMALFALPFAAAIASRLNIGVRHVLPATAFLAILGCAGFALAWERKPRLTKGVIALLAVLLAAEWIVNRFDPLPFANLPSGGPVALHRRLADSNLEMGQDLWRVERWCEENAVEAIQVRLHDPQGLYEREVALHAYLLPRDDTRPTQFVEAIRPEDQQGAVPPRGLLALGESVMLRLGWVRLADVEPLARIGRTRIYRLSR